MKVTCDLCKNEIDVESIDFEKKIAKCNECNRIFDCDSQLQSSTKSIRRDDMELPKSLKLQKEKDELRIEYRWLSNQLLYLAPFCLGWDLTPILWYRAGIIPTDNPLALAYLVLHFVSGVFLTYFVLAGFINKTKLYMVKDRLQVTDIPLGFFRNITIKLNELDQLYSSEKIHRGKKLFWSSFEVYAILKSGKVVRLVSGLNKSEQALYIEQTVEDFLGIQDRLVDGEISRTESDNTAKTEPEL